MKAIPLDLSGVTWKGPAIDDPKILRDVPEELYQLLRQVNGFILHHGALHVRGGCVAPEWHSLRKAWRGPEAFSESYDAVRPDDVPFAQDLFGDQFLLRRRAVWRLFAETGEMEEMTENLAEFTARVSEDIDAFLNVHAAVLEPGQLMLAYPPFCVEGPASKSTLSAVPALEAIAFHANVARQLKDVPDGAKIEFKVVD
ncbi:MAG: hypothetical protein ACXW32_10230 [Limisphaerales bacterium]